MCRSGSSIVDWWDGGEGGGGGGGGGGDDVEMGGEGSVLGADGVSVVLFKDVYQDEDCGGLTCGCG